MCNGAGVGQTYRRLCLPPGPCPACHCMFDSTECRFNESGRDHGEVCRALPRFIDFTCPEFCSSALTPGVERRALPRGPRRLPRPSFAGSDVVPRLNFTLCISPLSPSLAPRVIAFMPSFLYPFSPAKCRLSQCKTHGQYKMPPHFTHFENISRGLVRE